MPLVKHLSLALGHSWADATCEDPKTCATCDKTEGEALGHSWEEATCEAPKTCATCGETEGEALDHSFGEWMEIDEENEERICSACDFAEQQTIDREATMLRLLEGEWIMGEAVSGDVILGMDELSAEFEGTSFRFNSEGYGTLVLMGDTFDGCAEFAGYERDGTDYYVFGFVSDGESVDCALNYDPNDESLVFLKLDDVSAIIFHKTV